MMEGDLVKRRGGSMSRKDGSGEKVPDCESGLVSEEMMDFTMDELREFLEADHLDVRADPVFKERLRDKLWDLVQSRFGAQREK